MILDPFLFIGKLLKLVIAVYLTLIVMIKTKLEVSLSMYKIGV